MAIAQPMQSSYWRDWSHQVAASPDLQAFWILRVGYTVLPIIAGLDKYFHVLTDWDRYLSPEVNRALGEHGHGFMLIVGAVEIVAGIGVALMPRVFGYVVAAWLALIIANLMMTSAFNDVGLRDLGLLLGAVALARLAVVHERR